MIKVLVVDDEPLALNGLARMLGRIPEIEVMARLENGLLAKEYLKEHPVDIVFSDIRMPVMDGLALAKWMSEQSHDWRMVLVSAYRDFEYAQRAISFRVKDYVLKPFRIADLTKVIDRIMAERRQQEKELLWKADMNRVTQDLDTYHALMDRKASPLTEQQEKLIYMELQIQLPKFDRALTEVAVFNILSWCIPDCVLVLKSQADNVLQYAVIIKPSAERPDVDFLKRRIDALLETDASISMLRCAELSEVVHGEDEELDDDQLGDRIIQAALQYIRENIATGLSRQDVADAVHLEQSYFSKYFKRKVGVNFQNYIQEQRIARAMELLRQGYKAQDAARMSGFDNRNYFNQIFKKYAGCSPSEYRRENFER